MERDDEGPPGFPPDVPIVVPDDAGELARDIEAWRREQRWLRRERTLQRVLFTRRWRQHGVSGPLVIVLLLAVAMLGATISLASPHVARSMTEPVPLTLADPAIRSGVEGGLVPDVQLTGSAGRSSARDFRPAVIAILPAGCGCGRALASLVLQAESEGLMVFLVARPAQSAEAAQLASRLAGKEGADVRAMVDPQGAMSIAYSAHGLTAVPVHADGVTEAPNRDFVGGNSLGTVLSTLWQAGLAQAARTGP
jgi:hypothetical protein